MRTLNPCLPLLTALIAIVAATPATATSPSAYTVSPSLITFNYQTNGTLPTAQNLTITSNVAEFFFSYTAVAQSANNWLSVLPTSGGPTNFAQVSVRVDPSNLATGTYLGTITINVPNQPVTVSTVQLLINGGGNAGGSVTVQPSSLSFAYLSNQPQPAPQTIIVASASATPLTATATIQSGAPGWLSVSGGGFGTAAAFTVTVNPSLLGSGTFSGTVTILANGLAVQAVPVIIGVNTGALTISPASLSFSYQSGQAAPAPQTLAVTSPTAVALTASASSSGNWLSVQPTAVNGTTTAQTFQVSVSPFLLGQGTFTGTITFLINGATAETANVTLRVNSESQITATPNPMSFTYAQDAIAVQTSQTLTITTPSPAPVTLSASSSGNWLIVPAQAVTVPTAQVNVSVSSGLPAGNYSGQITVKSAGLTDLVVPVTLTVTSGSGSGSLSLFFSYQAAGLPPNQSFDLVTMQPSAFTVTANGIKNGIVWLAAGPPSGTTAVAVAGQNPKATISVAVAPQNLSPGIYTGTIAITLQGYPNQIVNVTLIVGTPPSNCVFSLSRAATTGSFIGDTQTVSVNASDPTCSWTASSPALWITLSNAANRSGNGRLQLSMAANADPAGRSASLIVAGVPFNVTQTGAGCGFTLGGQTQTAPSGGGDFSVTVASPGGCVWGSSAAPVWIALPAGAANFSGPGILNYTVAASSDIPRSGSVNVGGQILQVIQASSNAPQYFTDVPPPDPFFNQITILRNRGITLGCAISLFCPGDSTTREQMAVFIIRALIGDDFLLTTNTPYFTDVPANSPTFRYVQKMCELGITSGCTTTTYCPADPVTRGQMAVFVVRARLSLSSGDAFASPATPLFTDVPANDPFFSYIQKMKELGITIGCSVTQYCPGDATTRGQMAVFIVRGLLTP